MSPGGFDDLNIALRLRDTISRMVREEMNRVRPPEQYGRALAVNRAALTCSVLLNGDTNPITVKMSSQIQPRETDAIEGFGKGCMVLVGGSSGNYWIKDIISGHSYSEGMALSGAQLYSGDQGVALHQTVEAQLPALNSVYHIGRWDNTASSIQDGRGYLWISVRQDLFSSLMKTYEVSLKLNGTNGVWQKLASSTDHGTASGNDLELEIMSDNTGFELRVRRTKDGGGFTPGSYLVSLWAHMDKVVYDPTNVGESAATAPTRMYGTTVPGDDNGPFLSYGLNYNNRAQMNMQGGGTTRMNTSTNIFSWSERFLLFGQGRNQYSPSGSLEIVQPPNGTAIPVFGSLLATSVNATSAGVPLQNNQTLYYEVPYGDVITGVATNFRIVAHDDTNTVFTVPSHWVMVASRADSLTLSGGCKVGNGELLNGPEWITYTPTFENASGSPTNGNATVVGRYRRVGRTVHVMASYILGSTTNLGTGNMYFILPVNVRNTVPDIVGYGMAQRASPLTRDNFTMNMSSTADNRALLIGSKTGTVYNNTGGSQDPWAWASGDLLRLNATYEAAF